MQLERITEPQPWWKMTEKITTLVGMQCGDCKRTFFPPRRTCPTCGSRKALQSVDLPASGKLVTWTMTKVLPEEHEEREAVLGLADFGGALILAKIRRLEAEELEKDLLLSVELDPSRTDPIHPRYSFYFVPTEKGSRTEK